MYVFILFDNSNTVTLGEAPLTEQDRTEMRLGLIINGDKKIASTGIKAATQESLLNGCLASFGGLHSFHCFHGVVFWWFNYSNCFDCLIVFTVFIVPFNCCHCFGPSWLRRKRLEQ